METDRQTAPAQEEAPAADRAQGREAGERAGGRRGRGFRISDFGFRISRRQVNASTIRWWLVAAVVVGGGASALFKGAAPDLVTPARAKIAAWTAAPKPDDTIWAAVDAAKAGNVERYLALFGQPMRGQLVESRREMGETAFRAYLVQTAAQPKGIAVSRIEDAESAGTPRFRVEFIFEDRNEVQQYTLERERGRWQIARVDGAERIKTLIPYGTPVEKAFGAR